MTNQPSMIDIIENAQRLSNQSDRVAFFALGILGILAGVMAIRYLANRDEKNSERLETITNELRGVVENNTTQVQLCKEALNRNTAALEAFENTALSTLETHRISR